MENATLTLAANGLVSHLKLYFDLAYLDVEEDEGEVYEEDALQQHREAQVNFMINAWEVFRAGVKNSNLDAFSKYMDYGHSWFSEGSLAKVFEIGRCLAVIYHYLLL